MLVKLEPEEENDDYDMVSLDGDDSLSHSDGNDRDSGSNVVIEAEVNEEVEMQIIKNPYYEKGIEITQNQIVTNKHPGFVPDFNDVEIIAATKNLYYDQ